MAAKIAFIDRDGVINAYPGDFKYVTCAAEFRMLPGAAAAIRALKRCGFTVFVISNQAGVAKGLYSRETLDEITKMIHDALQTEGTGVDGVFYCTHRSEERCGCRKPADGLIRAAIADLKKNGMEADLARSFFIGDSMIDVETGSRAGIRTILVFSGREKPENRPEWNIAPDFTAQDLKEAAAIACAQTS